METIHTLNNLYVQAQLIKEYSMHRLFFCQDRIVLTNMLNQELVSHDVLKWINEEGISW